MTDQDPTNPQDPPPGQGEPGPGRPEPDEAPTVPHAGGPTPRKLLRSTGDRIIGGVAGGLGRYFAIDPIIVRITLVALAVFGGVGVFVYLAALLFVPPDDRPDQGPAVGGSRLATIAGAVVLGIALIAALGNGLFFFDAFPFSLVLLAVGGGVLYWLLRDRVEEGGAGRMVARLALGVALLIAAGFVAVGAFWASALGGGAVIAGLIVVIGVLLLLSAFRGGRARWLAVPALVLAVPVGIVSAADIKLDGGYGEREFRPTTPAQLAPSYRLGAGAMQIDMRAMKFPPGERRLNVGMGMGQVVLVVPEDVCVTADARVGAGYVNVLDRENGGVDVDLRDDRPSTAAAPRLRVSADMGMGALLVVNRPPPEDFGRGPGRSGPQYGPQMKGGPGAGGPKARDFEDGDFDDERQELENDPPLTTARGEAACDRTLASVDAASSGARR